MTLQLPPNGQMVRTLDELFPEAETSSHRGTVTVNSDGGTIAFMVTQLGRDGAVAEMPAAPLRSF